MSILRMSDLDLAGQRVLIREDLNVPVRDGKVTSEQRILAALPTLKLALDRGAAVLVMSHLGRPEEGLTACARALRLDPSLARRVASVLGTFGVERWLIRWKGQAAHAGSTPMDKRRDALAGAAKLALEIRDIAARAGGGAVCTSGGVVCKPGIVTSVVETAEQLLDQRHLDAATLATMLREAQEASRRFAEEEDVEVEWERIWNIQPILFHEQLVDFADEAIREVAGESHRLPSGPLHDAAEPARIGIPTVMLFVQSLRGLSHTKVEDTKPEHLELSVAALDRLTSKTIAWVAGRA